MSPEEIPEFVLHRYEAIREELTRAGVDPNSVTYKVRLGQNMLPTPRPEDGPGAFQRAADFCRQTAAVLNAQANPEATGWWQQAEMYENDARRLQAGQESAKTPACKMTKKQANVEAISGKAECPEKIPAPADTGDGRRKRSVRMTVTDANEKAMELAKRMKSEFFLLPERKQAKKIGCHWKTWKRTPFYHKAKEMRSRLAKRIVQGSIPGSPPVVSLTEGHEAVIAEGRPDEIVHQLADAEEAHLKAGRKWEDLTPDERQQIEADQKAEDDQSDSAPRKFKPRKRV